MTEKKDFDRSRFEEALKRYLKQAKWHPHREAFDLTRDGEYHCVSSLWQPFYVGCEREAHSLLVCEAAVLELVMQIHELSDGRIRTRLLGQTIAKSIQERLTYPVPFSDEALQQCSDDVYSILRDHYKYQSEALVPLYNVEFRTREQVEIELANAILCPGGNSSLLAKKLEQEGAESFRDEIQRCAFLKVKVSGDIESRRAQAEIETEHALTVLRFVTNWSTRSDKTPARFNRAHGVSQWPADRKTIVFHDPQLPDSYGHTSYRPDSLTISNRYYEDARFAYGLDYLNYFFRNVSHPYSKRVRQALRHYDLGATSISAWEAMYQYVVCVNVALPTAASKGTTLRTNLQTLINSCGYVGNRMKQAESLGSPETTEWTSAVRMTIAPFERFYTLRGQLLHGNDMEYADVSDSDVHAAQELALNAVVAIAILAREFNWSDYKEGKRWFDNPVPPPSMSLINDVSAIRRELDLFHRTVPSECKRVKELLNEICREFGKATPEVSAVENWIGELEHYGQTLFLDSRIPQWTGSIREAFDEMRLRFDGLIQLRLPPV